ncbi:MAG: hypothetical protein QM737_15810 [Ferruginibacter sp.]
MTFTIFLVLHILGGSVGLLSGTINLVRKKGDKRHKLVGKFFLYGMLTAGISSLALSIIHPNYFLFIVGLFTIYLIATGSRYLHLKMLGHNQQPAKIDWAITIIMLLTGLIFIGFGIKLLVVGKLFGIVFIVFGALAIFLVRIDFKNYKGKIVAKNYWLLSHLQRMTGAYIASLTAFLAVNATYFPEQIPGFIFWLLPTVILVPLIFKWTNKYKVDNK